MKRKFTIITDLADLSPEFAKKNDIKIAQNKIDIHGMHVYTLYEYTLSPDQFLTEIDQELIKPDKAILSTSLPQLWDDGDPDTPPSIEELVTESAEAGKDVIYLACNSAITGSYQTVSAFLNNEMADRYPDIKMFCIDTQCASTGLGMLIRDLLAANVDSVEDAFDFIETNRHSIAHIFSWSDLSYVRRSGKVSGSIVLAQRIAGFRPIGCVANHVPDHPKKERPLTILSHSLRVRGDRKSAKFIAEIVARTIKDGEVTVNHGNNPAWAELIAKAIQKLLPETKVLYGPDYRVGNTIQAHGGPTSMHINYHWRTQYNDFRELERVVQSILKTP